MLKSASNKLNNLFSKVELTAFAQGHFSVINDRATSDLRLNMMVTTLPAVPDEGQLSSVRSRSAPPDVRTVRVSKPTFSSAASAALSVSNATDSRHRVANVPTPRLTGRFLVT